MLDAWEQGQAQSLPERALTLLAAARSQPRDQLARLTIGERDARLLALREQFFGAKLTARATCPACGEQLEITLAADDLRRVAAEHPATENESVTATPDVCFPLEIERYQIVFRLPDSNDLAAITVCESIAEAKRVLLTKCLLKIECDGAEMTAEELPSHVAAHVAERMAQVDPGANIELALRCSGCAHFWSESFDINTFLWSELDAWARRLLREVHTLARAYGWSEAEILSLSGQRRRFYLDMVR